MTRQQGATASRIALAAAALAAIASASLAASFQPLGLPPGEGNSFSPAALSGDGRVVVGTGVRCADPRGQFCEIASYPNPTGLYLWSADEGFEDLTSAPIEGADRTVGWANDVSSDGSVVVGYVYFVSEHHTTPGHPELPEYDTIVGHAQRWTRETGWTALEPDTIMGTAVSGDGRVIATGRESESGLWTAAEGFRPIELDPDEGMAIHALSDDGSVAVGWCSADEDDEESEPRACLWSETGGLVDLVPLARLAGEDDRGPSFTFAVSSNGRVAAGGFRGKLGKAEAFVWTAESGLRGLGFLDPIDSEPLSTAWAVSGDGKHIFGTSAIRTDDPVGWGFPRAVVWWHGRAPRALDEILAQDVDLQGWTLEHVVDVSTDGSVVLGTGHDVDGLRGAWIATVPEPRGVLSSAIALLALASLAKPRCAARPARGSDGAGRVPASDRRNARVAQTPRAPAGVLRRLYAPRRMRRRLPSRNASARSTSSAPSPHTGFVRSSSSIAFLHLVSPVPGA